ncbi:FCD domain-containing protein [Falsirhodobacter xinxiangensis]|uniref:FCD domain-containing protein n=1 Tax=Falsirhodobacter xinxiangensis TaxID=2530049 RepID=UPI0010A9E0A2|nr:FCD domain-containing protein [Rhodobacter xinxiangensis]
MTDTPKTERAAEAVARHIEGLILEGTLRPGEMLLPERELALRLGVSRPTLRDGLKDLEARGLLEPSGRGIAVARLGAALIADPLVALLASRAEVADDYLEFRAIIEQSAARMAAMRANEVDRGIIEGCLTAIDAAHDAGDPVQEAEADADLHMAIYEASHNVVLLQIMRALSGKLRSDVMGNRAQLFTLPKARDALRDQHRAIAAAILAGKPERAANAAGAHIDWLRDAVRRVKEAEAQLDLSLRRLDGGKLTR